MGNRARAARRYPEDRYQKPLDKSPPEGMNGGTGADDAPRSREIVMRPYGLEFALIAGPDVGDIKAQARKGCIGRVAGKSGDYHAYSRGGASKRATRRTIKRGARATGRAEIARTLRDD
jgi:hypothetical protein